MTHKSRIYAPIDTNPLPKEHCTIDIKLECGSVLIGCRRTLAISERVWFGNYPNTLCIDLHKIKSWRYSK